MNEAAPLILAFAAGVLLGAIFFGGLAWTVRKGVVSDKPARLFFFSFWLRMGIAVAGFYVVGHNHGERLLVCLLGFVMARLLATWLTRPSRAESPSPIQEARHAP